MGEGRRIRLDGRDRFEGYMRGLAERQGDLYNGGPDRFLGVMFAAAPIPRADSARVHFDKASAIEPLFFANLTLRAEYLSVLEKDSVAFRETLERVLAMPSDTLPGAEIEN